jgi:hypothetical protein
MFFADFIKFDSHSDKCFHKAAPEAAFAQIGIRGEAWGKLWSKLGITWGKRFYPENGRYSIVRSPPIRQGRAPCFDLLASRIGPRTGWAERVVFDGATSA